MELVEARELIDTFCKAGRTREETAAIVAALDLNGHQTLAFEYIDSLYKESGGVTDYNLTDAGNAELFTALYGDTLRYDHQRGRWLEWRGHYWKPETDGEVTRLALKAVRKRYQNAVNIEDLKQREVVSSWAIKSEARGRIEALLGIGRDLKPIADSGERWDLDPWLLGVKNGVIDLHTGKLRAGEQADGITMQAGPEYDAEAEAPRWHSFLNEVLSGDAALISWLQRYLGYALTGDVSEQCLCLGYGRGANGKTVLLNVLRTVMGDYGYDAPFSTFELNQRAAIPNDMAALRGRRFVSSSETNEGTRLNEARIKALTGGDSVTARFLHQEYFTFNPTGKFFLAVNHKPRVRDDSTGFWRRVRLIPFTRQFTGQAADKRLAERLNAEASGILNWLLEGCLRWQGEGLDDIPEAVIAATSDYEQESDPLADFIEDECALSPAYYVAASRLYQQYKAWANGQGYQDKEVMTNTAFGRRIAGKYRREKRRGGATYHGIGLKCDGFLALCDELEGQNNVFLHTNHSRGDNSENPPQPTINHENPSPSKVASFEKPVTNPSHPQRHPTSGDYPDACTICGSDKGWCTTLDGEWYYCMNCDEDKEREAPLE